MGRMDRPMARRTRSPAAKACPYNAIIYMERPCAAACGMDAIEMDDSGKAVINQDPA